MQAALQAPMFETRWRWNAMRSLALLRSRGGRRVPPCHSAHARAGSDRGGVPGPDRLPGQPRRRRRSRSPTTRWCARRCATAWSRRWTPRACAPCWRRWRTAASRASAQRAARAVGVRARDPEREPVRVPRRRAAGRAPHARGRDPPRAARRRRRANRRPRSGGDRSGRGRGAARPARRRRASRSSARSRRAAGGDRARAGLDRAVRRAGATAGGPPASTATPRHWVAAERRSVAAAVWPDRRFVPDVVEPPSRRAAPPDGESALVEIVRGHLALLGPTTADAIAARLGVRASDVDAALARLEMEGAVLRGRFRVRRVDEATQWCDRRLLARINRHMLDGLRREIEPVSAADFLRFLFGWQHVRPGQPAPRPAGPGARDRRASGLRSGGRRLGARDPSGARRRLRSGLAGCALPLGRRHAGGDWRRGPRAARPAARRRSRSCAAPTCPGC